MADYIVEFVCQDCGQRKSRSVTGRGKLPKYCDECSTQTARVDRWRRLHPDKYAERTAKQNAKRIKKSEPMPEPVIPTMRRIAHEVSSRYFIKNRPASLYQEAIFEELLHGRGDVLVNAAAGSGKSTTLLEGVKLVMDKLGLPPSQVLILAFNKHIMLSMRKQVEADGYNIPVQTIHSLGFGAVARHVSLKKGAEVDEEKYRELAGRWLESEIWRRFRQDSKKFEGFYDLRQALKKAVDLTRLTLTPYRDVEAIIQLSFRYDFEVDEEDEWVFRGVAPIIDQGAEALREQHWYDWTDMLFLPYLWNLNLKKVRLVCIDEAQDLSALQRELVLKLRAPGGRFLFFGDPRQSIMGFAGADVRSFWQIKDVTGAKELPLSISYRCPKSHIALAQAIVPTIEAHPDAPEGEIHTITPEELLRIATTEDRIIGRKTAPLVEMALRFIAIKRLARVQGQANFGASMSALVKKIEKKTKCKFETFETGTQQYLTMERARLSGRDGGEGQIKRLEDKCQSLLAIYRDSEKTSMKGFLQEVIDMFEDTTGAIMLSTVHRAKGLEENRIFILNPEDMPLSWNGQQPWEIEQEMNIKYVALTRAKRALYFVEDPEAKKREDDERKDRHVWHEDQDALRGSVQIRSIPDDLSVDEALDIMTGRKPKRGK